MAKYHHFEELTVWQSVARLYHGVLDLLEEQGQCFSSGYQGLLDRGALSVSNNVAEGFARVTTAELISFLTIAKGSAGEVASMIAVLQNHPRGQPCRNQLLQFRNTAPSCTRQLYLWIANNEASPLQDKPPCLPYPQTKPLLSN